MLYSAYNPGNKCGSMRNDRIAMCAVFNGNDD